MRYIREWWIEGFVNESYSILKVVVGTEIINIRPVYYPCPFRRLEFALLNVPPALGARSTASVCVKHTGRRLQGSVLSGLIFSAGSKEAENLAPATNENPEPNDMKKERRYLSWQECNEAVKRPRGARLWSL